MPRTTVWIAASLCVAGCEPEVTREPSTPLEAAGMWTPGVEFSRVKREAVATGGIVMHVADDRVGAIEIGNCQQFTVHWPPEERLFSVVFVNSTDAAYPLTNTLTGDLVLHLALAAFLQSGGDDGIPEGLAEHCGVPETYLSLAATRAGIELVEAHEARQDSIWLAEQARLRAEQAEREAEQAEREARIEQIRQAVRDSFRGVRDSILGLRSRSIPFIVIDNPGEAAPCGSRSDSGGALRPGTYVQGRYTPEGDLRTSGVVWRDDVPDLDALLPGFAMYRDCVVRKGSTWQPRIVVIDGNRDTVGVLP